MGQVNAAFAGAADAQAAMRPEPGPDSDSFIDLDATLASIPGIAAAVLEPGDAQSLRSFLAEGDHALLIAGPGRYVFKGPGYVRGGIFDRIQLIQGELSVRFRDREQMRIAGLGSQGAPALSELGLFRIPAGSGFDPIQPFRLPLLVQPEVGAIERVDTTFDMAWQPPAAFLRPVATVAA